MTPDEVALEAAEAAAKGKSYGTSRKLGIYSDVEVPIVKTRRPAVTIVDQATRNHLQEPCVSEVVQIRPRASETFVCPCGSQRFSMHYRMDTAGKIIERSGVATCDGGCGRQHHVSKK